MFLLATTPGTGLDAVQGKVLDEKYANLQNQITQINSDLLRVKSTIRNIDKQLDNGQVALEWDDGAGLRVTIDGTYVGMVTLR